ncbi:hypothetical protein ANO14919_069910 [Xylariales sp. No.14919]|nr:hypothetical protein ANO14919_069910 [Xylariales sp. No.14919]
MHQRDNGAAMGAAPASSSIAPSLRVYRTREANDGSSMARLSKRNTVIPGFPILKKGIRDGVVRPWSSGSYSIRKRSRLIPHQAHHRRYHNRETRPPQPTKPPDGTEATTYEILSFQLPILTASTSAAGGVVGVTVTLLSLYHATASVGVEGPLHGALKTPA